MTNISADEVIVSIVVPILIICIIFYFYKKKMEKLWKNIQKEIKRLPIGEEIIDAGTLVEKVPKIFKKEIENIKNEFRSMIPKLRTKKK